MMSPLLALIPILIAFAIIIFAIREGASGKTIAGLAVVVVMFAAILVPVLDSIDDDSHSTSIPDVIYYDDYIDVDKEMSTSGVFEYIDVDGHRYVHATDVGSGKINGKTYAVQKAPLDVFLFLGQSNAANWAGVQSLQVSPTPHPGCGYYFGIPWHQANKNLGLQISDYAFYPISTNNSTSRIGGIDAPFAIDYYNLTGHKSYMINGAIGGVNIESYLPGATSYEYAQELFDAAYAAIDTDRFVPEIQSYVWIQGESNANTAVSTYKSDFLQMHETLIGGTFTDYGSFKMALISKVRAVNAPNPSEAQIELCEEYPETIKMVTEISDTFTVENGLMTSDNLHYSQQGRNEIGLKLAEYYSRLF